MTTAAPELANLKIESLLPHRGRMLLVDEIVDLDPEERRATTRAVAAANWPFFDQGSISPLVLIELVAQTAGIRNGWELKQTRGTDDGPKGYIVGVKRAVFHVDRIQEGTTITTCSHNVFAFENLREISGTASIDGKVAAEVTLQVMEGDPAEGQGSMNGERS